MKLTLPFEGISAMLGRMTSREKRLFGILAGAVVGAIAVGTYLTASAFFGGIQEDIDHGRQVLAELNQLAPHYQELADQKKQMEEAIRGNRVSVRVAANEYLRKMELSDEIAGATGNKLSDIVSFEGKTTDTPVDMGKTPKKKPVKGKKEAGIVEVEQNLEFREVPVQNLMAFLDAVEAAKDLLFVTKVDTARKFNDLTHVRATVTIATFQYQGEESEPEPGTQE